VPRLILSSLPTVYFQAPLGGLGKLSFKVRALCWCLVFSPSAAFRRSSTRKRRVVVSVGVNDDGLVVGDGDGGSCSKSAFKKCVTPRSHRCTVAEPRELSRTGCSLPSPSSRRIFLSLWIGLVFPKFLPGRSATGVVVALFVPDKRVFISYEPAVVVSFSATDCTVTMTLQAHLSCGRFCAIPS